MTSWMFEIYSRVPSPRESRTERRVWFAKLGWGQTMKKFWFNSRMSGEELAYRGAGPHFVYRNESWIQLLPKKH